MQEFPPNSKQARGHDEPKKIERVTSAEAVRRKRGLGRRFKETFIGGDARSAFGYVVTSVIIPETKDLFYNAFDSWFKQLLFGDSVRPRRGPSGPLDGYSSGARVAYNRMSTGHGTRPPEPRMLSRRARARHNFDDIVISSRREAQEVLDQMFTALSQYGEVSVADLYVLTGIRSDHTDHKWGWRNLQGANVLPVRSGGFLLDLPEPEPFD